MTSNNIEEQKISSFTYVVLQNLDLHDRCQHQKAKQNVQLFFAWYRNAIHWKTIEEN